MSLFFPRFTNTMLFFDFTPTKKDSPVPEFFSTWAPFCNDFKTIWRNEQQRLLKEKMKEAEKIVKQKRGLLKNIIIKKPRESMGLVSRNKLYSFFMHFIEISGF